MFLAYVVQLSFVVQLVLVDRSLAVETGSVAWMLRYIPLEVVLQGQNSRSEEHIAGAAEEVVFGLKSPHSFQFFWFDESRMCCVEFGLRLFQDELLDVLALVAFHLSDGATVNKIMLFAEFLRRLLLLLTPKLGYD